MSSKIKKHISDFFSALVGIGMIYLVLLFFYSIFSGVKEVAKSDFVNEVISSNEELILGKWEVVSAIVYSDGKESKVEKKRNEMNFLVGSYNVPRYYKFTKHNEMFMDKINNNQNGFNQIVFQYKLDDDRIILDDSILYMKSLNSKELVFEQELMIEYFDKTKRYPKIIYTFFLRKVNN